MAKVTLTSEQKLAADSKALTKRCKKILKVSEISQKELADYMGLTPQAISYELQHEVMTRTLIAIAELTGRQVLSEKEII